MNIANGIIAAVLILLFAAMFIGATVDLVSGGRLCWPAMLCTGEAGR